MAGRRVGVVKPRARAGGPLCPTHPEHGELLAIPGVTGFYCPSQAHDGIPRGATGEYRIEPSRNRWTIDELAVLA